MNFYIKIDVHFVSYRISKSIFCLSVSIYLFKYKMHSSS